MYLIQLIYNFSSVLDDKIIRLGYFGSLVNETVLAFFRGVV